MARRSAWLLLLALPALVLPAPAPSPATHAGEVEAGGGTLWGVLPALALLVSLATIIIGCSWCHRYRNCKLFGARRASARSVEAGRAQAEPDGADDAQEPPAEVERGPVLLSRGPLPPDNNNVAEDNNNGPISAREMQNIENNNAAVYIISENENRNALSAARGREAAAVRLNASRESVVEFEPLPVDITPHHQHQPRTTPPHYDHDHWFAPQYEEFPRSQLQYLREIGRGSFGRIVEGEVESLGGAGGARAVAVKILEQHATRAERARFLRDALVFRDLRHENILALLARNLSEDPWLLVFDLCSMDLQQYLISNRPKMGVLNEKGTPLRLKCDVTAGLAYLHSHGYVYGSVWSGGVLVSSAGGEGEVRARLGHYGDARAPRLAPWSAPEVMARPGIAENSSSETWSLGVVLWEVCSWGELPPAALPTAASPPLLPCPYRDHLYQVMQLCWNVNPERRPTTAQVHALLNHLYTSHLANQRSPHDPRAGTDFEDRWQRLKPNSIPKVDEHVAIVHADTHTLSSRFTRSQDDFREEAANLLAVERETLASRSSSIMSDTLPNNKSDSLTNLHGSLEDMRNVNYITSDATVLEVRLEATAERTLCAEPERASCEDLTEKLDPWLAEVIANGDDVGYYRDVSDVIKNLDSILNSEKTSSSESSHQASPSRENLVLQMRDVPPPPSGLVKSPGIADFQNILELPSLELQSREEDDCVADGFLRHSFERNSQKTTPSDEQTDVVRNEDNAIKRTPDTESNDVSEIIENEEKIASPSPIYSCLANSSVSSNKFECETKDCRESCDNVKLLKTFDAGDSAEIDIALEPVVECEVKLNSATVQDTSADSLSTGEVAAHLDKLDKEVIDEVEPRGDLSEQAESEKNSISDTEVLSMDNDSTVYMDLKGAPCGIDLPDNNNSLNKAVEKNITKLCSNLKDYKRNEVIDVEWDLTNDSTRYLELPQLIDTAAFLHEEKSIALPGHYVNKSEATLKSPSGLLDNGSIFTSTPKVEDTIEAINNESHTSNKNRGSTEIRKEGSIESSRDCEPGVTITLEKQSLPQEYVVTSTPKDDIQIGAECATLNEAFQLTESAEIPDEKTSESLERENLSSIEKVKDDNLQGSPAKCTALNYALTYSKEYSPEESSPDSLDRDNPIGSPKMENHSQGSPVIQNVLNETYQLTDSKDFSSGENATDSLDNSKNTNFQATSAECTALNQRFELSCTSNSNEREEQIPDYGPGVTITRLTQEHAPQDLEKVHDEPKPIEDSSVVLGPFENCTLDYFTGIKTETHEAMDSDLPREELLAFSSNFVELNLDSENVRTDQLEGPESLPTDSIEKLPEDRPYDTMKVAVSPTTPPNSPGNCLSSNPQHKYLTYEQSLSPTEPSLSPIPTHSMCLDRNMLEDAVDLSHIEIQLTTKLAMAENENNMNIEYSGPLSIDELPPPDSLETVVGLEDADVETPPECNECPQEGGGRREGYWVDEACMRALRNELELKLPLAQASGCEPVDDMPMELPPPPAEAECEVEAGAREEVVVCYPGALSPILEETDPQLTAYHNNLNWTHSQRTDSSESYPEPCNNSTDEMTDLVTAMRSVQRDPPPDSDYVDRQSDDSADSRTFTVHKEEASNEISMSADSLNGTDDGTLKDVIMPSTSVQIPSQPAVAEPSPELAQVKSPDTECERISQISPYLLSPTVDSCKLPTDSNDFASNISKLSRPTLPSDVKSSKASDTQCLSKATSIDSWCSNDTLFNVEDNFDELVMDSDAEENAQQSRSSGTLTRDDDNGGPTYIVHGSDSDKCDSFTPDSITANYTYTKVRTESPTKSVTKCPENDAKVEILEVINQATSDTGDCKQLVGGDVEHIDKDVLLNTSMNKDVTVGQDDEITTDKLVSNESEKNGDVVINDLLKKDLINNHDFVNSIESLNRDASINSDDIITNTFSVKKHVESPIERIRDSSADYCLNMTPPIYNNITDKRKDSLLNADGIRPIVSKMESVDMACLKEDFEEDNEDLQLKNATMDVSEVSPTNCVGSTLSPERHYRGMANSVTSTPLVLEAKDEPVQSESQELVFKMPQAIYMNVPHFEAFVNSAELRPQDMSPFMRLDGGTPSDLKANVAVLLHNGSKEDPISLNSNVSAKSCECVLEDKTSGYLQFQSSARNKLQDLSPVDPDRGTFVCPNVLDGITSSSEFLQSERLSVNRPNSFNISERLPSETVRENGLDHVIEANNEVVTSVKIVLNNLICADTTNKEEIRPECLPQTSIDNLPKGTLDTLECEPIIEEIQDECTSSIELSNLKEEIKYPSITNDESTEGSIENPIKNIPSVIIENHLGDVHTYIPVQAVKSGLEFRNDNCPSFSSFENSVQAKPQELSSLTNQNCTDIPNASKTDVEFSSFERSAANKPQDLSSAVKSDCSQSSHNLNETYDSHKSGQNLNETFQTFDSHRTQRKPESFNDGDESDPKDSSPDSSRDQNEDLETSNSPHNNVEENKSNENNDNSHEYNFDSLKHYINPRKANEHLKSDNLNIDIVQVHIDPIDKAEYLNNDKKKSSTVTQPQEDLGFYENMESKNDSLVSVSEDNPHSDEILDKEISSTASTAESEPTTREMDSLDNHLEIINEEVIIHNEIIPERQSVVFDTSSSGKLITKKVDMVNEQDIVEAIEELDQVIDANGVDADTHSASPSSCRSEDRNGQCEERVVRLDPAEMCSVTDSFIEHEKSFSEINACLPLLRDIRFTGPSCDYMSTSFNQDSPSEDASMMMLESELRKAEENAERLGAASEALKEWESESEDSQTNSTSSGEFIWKDGEGQERFLTTTTDFDDRQQNGGGGSELGSIAEGSEGEGEGEGEGSDADGSEGDEVEFVPSSWDCRAAPAKSSMKSLEQSPTNDSKKRVVFKRQKYHCVYEYPREMIDDCDMSGGESRMLHSPYLPDYSAYAGSLWEALSAGGAGDVDLGYGYPPSAPLHLYHLPADAAFSPNYGLPDEDFFISSSARPFESLGIMSTTSQFFPGLHATLKAVGTLERGDSPDDEETEDFPPPPSPLAPVPAVFTSINTTHIPHSASLDFTTPDSGVEDVTPGCAIDDDSPASITGEIPPPPPAAERSRLKLRAPEGSSSSSESPSPSSPCWEALGGLRHTRDRLKLDLPPSPLHLGSSGSRHGQRVFNFLASDASPASREPPSLTPLVMSDETPVARAVRLPLEEEDELVVPEPTFSTFGKSNARNASAAPADAKPLLMDEECNASTEESPAKAESEVTVLRNKSLLEAVKGEGTVLDSGDEDSGIESSAKTTLERNPPHHSAT